MVAIRGEPDFENTSDENVTQMKKQQKTNGLKPIKAIKPLGIISQFGVEAGHQGNRTGNNGQIQLWQFLLEILTDREHRTIISWLGGFLQLWTLQSVNEICKFVKLETCCFENEVFNFFCRRFVLNLEFLICRRWWWIQINRSGACCPTLGWKEK